MDKIDFVLWATLWPTCFSVDQYLERKLDPKHEPSKETITFALVLWFGISILLYFK